MNHVNAKTLRILGAMAAIALAVAVVLHRGKRPETDTLQTAQPLVADLREHVNDVSAIVLTGANEQRLATIEKGAGGWTVKEKGGFAADAAKVREFLLKLSDATLLEAKTSSDKRYAELGVDDVKAADAKGVQVGLNGLSKPVAVIVGSFNSRGSGTFVRRVGEPQSWLAKGNLSVEKTASNWLDKLLGDIPATRVKEVVLTGANGKVLRAFKAQPTDANYTVADLPKGRELSSEFAANGLATGIAGLRFDDVVAEKDGAMPADAKPVKAHYVTFDGLTLDVTAWKVGEKVYARFASAFDAAAADPGIAAEQAKAKADWDTQQKSVADAPADTAKPTDKPAPPLAVSDPAKDRQQRLDALTQEAAALHRHFDGWVYVLPSYRYDAFAKGIDDLLKPLGEKKDDAKGKPAAPPSLLDALPGKH